MLRKSKGGFTLIELMVCVVIIGVLSVVGLRVYSGQVDKAKNAVIKANVGTIQTLIQAELADTPVTSLDTSGELSAIIFANAGIFNPVTGASQATCPENEALASAGEVWAVCENNVFTINGRNTDGDDNVFVNSLTATR